MLSHLDFLMTNDGSISSYACLPSMYLREVSQQFFYPLKNMGMLIFSLLKLESTLYIQDTSPLSDIWFANILPVFSPSLWFVFSFC